MALEIKTFQLKEENLLNFDDYIKNLEEKEYVHKAGAVKVRKLYFYRDLTDYKSK